VSIKVNLFLGEQDGLSFRVKHTPEVMWVMSYEARKRVAESERLGIEISDEEPLPRLPYRFSSINGEGDKRVALYVYDESQLYPPEVEAVSDDEAST